MRARAAFTLIEMLMVVLIVGILASVAIPTYSGQRDAARNLDAQTALEVAQRNGRGVYTLNDGTFPAAIATDIGDGMPEIDSVTECAAPCSTFPAQPRHVTVERSGGQKVTYRALSRSGQRVILQDWPAKTGNARVQRGRADAAHAATPYLNTIANPSLETNSAGYTTSGANAVSSAASLTWQPSGGPVGAGWLRGNFTAIGVSDNLYNQAVQPPLVDVSDGEQYYVHVRMQALTPMKWLQFQINVRTAAGVHIVNHGTEDDGYWVEDPEVGKWYDLEGLCTVSAADTPGVGRIRPIIQAFASAPGAGAWGMDAVSMVKVSDPDDRPRYCDGDSPQSSWTGADHASTSTCYSWNPW